MVRHNNIVPNQHFRKEWQVRVKTWFKQPMRKRRRRSTREAKAARIAPRPLDGPLRPAVRCQTVRYNSRIRQGRGFTLEELKEAGLSRTYARSVGISVDHRRKNRTVEGLQTNVQRLKEYKSKLIVFPKHAGKPKAGDSAAEELEMATQLSGKLMPIVNERKLVVEARAPTEEEKKFKAYAKLRLEMMNKKHHGMRMKKQKEKEEESK